MLLRGQLIHNIIIFDDPSEDLLNWFKKNEQVDDIVPLPETQEGRAQIGATWDGTRIIRLKPWPSWVLNEDYDWVAPIPYPADDENDYVWNEKEQKWVLRDY